MKDSPASEPFPQNPPPSTQLSNIPPPSTSEVDTEINQMRQKLSQVQQNNNTITSPGYTPISTELRKEISKKPNRARGIFLLQEYKRKFCYYQSGLWLSNIFNIWHQPRKW